MTETANPVSVDSVISLREVTVDNLRDVLRLEVAPEQERLVAPNSMSIAQAHFTPEAWFRAIYAGETPVGFVMLHDDPVQQRYFLWRLMLDRRCQRFGFGRQAMALLIDYVKTRPGATELLVSYVPAENGPEPFYRKLGFVPTGEILHDEIVARLPLEVQPAAASTAQLRPSLPKDGPAMFTHVVLFKLKDRSPENIAETVAVMRSMAGKIPTLRSVEAGADVVKSPRSYDIGLITRFDSLDDMKAYQAHPYHQDVVLKHINAVMESAAAVDFEGY